MIKEALQKDLKKSLLGKDSRRAGYIRLILAEIQTKENDTKNPKVLTDADTISLIEGMLKKLTKTLDNDKITGATEFLAKVKDERDFYADLLTNLKTLIKLEPLE